MAAADGRRARSRAGRARQPVPRPARPLRRARAARRRLGRDGRAPRRQQRFRAQCRRPPGRRPRTRPRAASPSGDRLLRDRGPRAGAARAPARARRQALPSLRVAVRVRARLRRPPRPLRVPELCGRPPLPRRGGNRNRAPRDGGLAGDDQDARRSSRARAAAAGPLQRLQRARGNRRRPAARRRARARRGRAERGRVGLRAGGDDPGRRHPGLDHADQEPRRRERGPAHAAARGRPRDGRGRRRLDLWIALNDRIADGRDVSWIWDADFELLAGSARRVVCAGTRAPEIALRLKYAGIDPESIEVEPSIERSLDRAVSRAGGRLFALPTYTALLELRKLLSARGLAPEYWR